MCWKNSLEERKCLMSMHTHKHVQVGAGSSVARHGQTTPAEMSQLQCVFVWVMTSETACEERQIHSISQKVEMSDELIWSNNQTRKCQSQFWNLQLFWFRISTDGCQLQLQLQTSAVLLDQPCETQVYFLYWICTFFVKIVKSIFFKNDLQITLMKKKKKT